MYYLETNALRALSGAIGKNKDLQLHSYTSIFALFELVKGIGKAKDSEARVAILGRLGKLDLKCVTLMPDEMFQAAFDSDVFVFDSTLVQERIGDISRDVQAVSNELKEIIARYEGATKKFQARITKASAAPTPPPEKFRLNLHEALSESIELPSYLASLPSNLHPSRIVMESLKQDAIPALYRQLNPEAALSNKDILRLYNDGLDLYLFVDFAYALRRKALREPASKNDLLDIIHAVYLVSHEDVIVSDDQVLASILPNVNRISVEEYRGLIESFSSQEE